MQGSPIPHDNQNDNSHSRCITDNVRVWHASSNELHCIKGMTLFLGGCQHGVSQ